MSTCIEALKRANELIETFSNSIGRVAPGKHASFYADLNDHFLHMDAIKRAEHGHVDNA